MQHMFSKAWFALGLTCDNFCEISYQLKLTQMETSFKKLSHIFCQIYFMTTWSLINFFLIPRPWDKFLSKDVEKDLQNLWRKRKVSSTQ